MMEVDEEQSPDSGSADSSRSETPATASTPSPVIEVEETVSILSTAKAKTGKQKASSKSKYVPLVPNIIKPRAYQREMLEQSLRRNVIVAMDTGSGKTQVAVLRIQAELERCSPDKLVWFLGKTVGLVEQQYNVIQGQMPSVPMRLLTGQLNIDAWSPGVWPQILEGTRIIVSTFSILRDALDHAFVTMDMLALIVFDEVHNCVKNNPGRKIMMNFYHRHKNAGMPVPAILGLTASPIISSDLKEIEKLENTMDAICATPTIHREQLLKHINKPHLVRSLYDVTKIPPRTPLMQQLQSEYSNMDIAKDPEVIKLKALAANDEKKRERLMNLIMKHDTFSQQQIKGLWNKSREILAELGSWAANYYISQMIKNFLGRIDDNINFTDAWSNEDRTYLAGHLRRINIGVVDNSPPTEQTISQKTSRLIHELLEVNNDVVGIIFVKERTAAHTLCKLLNNYPPIRDRYKVGAIVGASSYGLQKQKVYEYPIDSDKVLEDFRSGAIDLLVATSVLEEGIDVPACNLVVSFDEIATLKSFIQRRGRARMPESKMIALLSSSADTRAWEDLEVGMKERYEDDQRELDRLDKQAWAEDIDSTYYIVKNTGARLDLENARQHLDRFCQVVFRTDYITQLPEYVFHKEETPYGGPILRATVTLPGGLPLNLRTFKSACGWKSERNAIRDAAFQAYVALYEAGLVTDNLAPLNAKSEKVEEKIDLIPEPLFDPWVQIAQRWKSDCDKQYYLFEFTDEEFHRPCLFGVILPALVDLPRNITLYPGSGSKWSIVWSSVDDIPDEVSSNERDITSALLAMNFQHRWNVEDREHVIKMTLESTSIFPAPHVTRDSMAAYPFRGAGEEQAKKHRVLVRDQKNRPFHYVRMIPSKPKYLDVQHPFYEYEEAEEHEEYLVLEKWGTRNDLLHDLKDVQPKSSTKPYEYVLPISHARVDKVGRRVVKCGLFIPHITHELEVHLIASELSSTLLKPVGIENLQLVLEAISSPSACEPVNYQRLELLGDSILKFCAVTQAYSEHPSWPEGLLNHFKDRLVSNERLQRVCLEKGLSKFILSKSFTALKWRPLYLDDVSKEKFRPRPAPTRGSKTLADVVEALIGASYQDGGMTKALKCISVFLGDKCNWHQEGVARDILFAAAPSDVKLPSIIGPLEDLIKYTFRKKSLLLEAVTHPSYATIMQERSYEQLEFLGDAVLDYIVVTKMFQHDPPIPTGRLHMIKTAIVNGDFLSFVNLTNSIERKDLEVVTNSEPTTEATGDLEVKPEGKLVELITKTTRLPLWKFMRFNSSEMVNAMVKTEERFESMRSELDTALWGGDYYPWVLLARLQPPKFYSDMFEAIIGAVWVDSGSIEECTRVLESFRIMEYLNLVMEKDIHVQHPKEQLSKFALASKMKYTTTQIEEPEPRWSCELTIGERLVAEVEGSLNKVEAMAKAAEKAIRLLTGEMNRDDLAHKQDEVSAGTSPEKSIDHAMEGTLTENSEDKDLVVGPKKESKTKSLVRPPKNENTKQLATHPKEVGLAHGPIEEDLIDFSEDEMSVDRPKEADLGYHPMEEDLIGFSDDGTSNDRPSKKRPVDVSEDHEMADLSEKKKFKKF
ncbi:Dcl-2 dicer RNA helicase [Fusarium globosum]|uniref:Dcl-2 dicer RNA helicase n=1 Tax=Fusarium globosum TaxID=78864 RepID=A0A8H5XWJ2_9HYPO|nr:Dcl-2 dicer RNA helicase [Fusarium globosum]